MKKNKSTVVVIKIGSSVITTNRKQVDLIRLKHIADQAKALQEQGYKPVFVISGAVVCGEGTLPLGKSDDISKRLLAGGGQAHLISKIYEAFEARGIKIVQMLLTKKDLTGKKSRTDLLRIVLRSIEHDLVPIINENDVADLNSFEGNDYLASNVACLLGSSHLIVLTDVPGVYARDMRLMSEVSSVDFCRLAEIEVNSSKGSVGGMAAKISASQLAADNEVMTYIADGREKDVIIRVVAEGSVGTKVIKQLA